MGFRSIRAAANGRSRLLLLGGLLLAFLTHGAVAGSALDLYQAAVPVSGQGVEERNNAIGQAFSRVLVKVTGSRSAGEREGARELEGEAPGLVQQYRYQLAPSSTSTQSQGEQDAERQLLVRFDPRALQAALRDRGLPVWGTPRPTLLLWLALDQGGQRRFFQPESDAELARAVERVGQERGISLLLPLMDLEDLNRLQVGELWGGFEAPLRNASERYGADLVLVGRIGRDGAVSWKLLHGDRTEPWRSRGADAAGAATEGLQEAVDRIAARYGPASTGVSALGSTAGDGTVDAMGTTSGVLVRVRGIADLSGFVRVDRLFKSLDTVDNVALERLEPDQALFRLRLRGGVDALSRNATVGGVLGAEPLEPALAGSETTATAESVQLPDLSFRLLE